MKEQLIQLAKDKGFISLVIGKSVTAKYSNNPYYYLWLCELQKWLREKHHRHINIRHLGSNFFVTLSGGEHVNLGNQFRYYEEALEKGLQEQLKKIKIYDSNKKIASQNRKASESSDRK